MTDAKRLPVIWVSENDVRNSRCQYRAEYPDAIGISERSAILQGYERYVPHAQLVELERQLAEVTAERDKLRAELVEERASVMNEVLP
mgnify:CR=1 FL=1